MPSSSQQESESVEPSRWEENHGNFLLGVIGVILVLGSSVIALRQMRTHGPRTATIVRSDADRLLLTEQADAAALGNYQVVPIRVIGAVSDIGLMRIAVYTGPEGFNDPEKALAVDNWPIRDGISEGRLVLPGDMEELAIAAYHDENNNGRLDRNAFGIPTERYGFSGNARGLNGPPAYSEVAVPITGAPIEISIR